MSDPIKLLIVEDNEITAQLYSKLLSNAGYSVQHAPDTASAENLMTQTRFDLVILDYDLPDMIGVEWLRGIRHYPELERLPVVLVSNIKRDDNLRSDRYVWFMEKPTLPQHIVTAVQQTLDHFRS